MSIIDKITAWSPELPVWQQIGLKLLFENPDLSEDDKAHVYSAAKAEHETENESASSVIHEPVGLTPRKDTVQTSSVQIKAMKNLRNVNMLAEGQVLDFSPKGMTVIYGHNGTGKSGYSRVLKQACRARNQKEKLLANVRHEHGKTPPAKADIEVLVDGLDTELHWTFGGTSPEPLSAIAVFDSHCARAYVDNEGDFAYIPYGLDLLHKLVKLCGEIKDRAEREKQQNLPNYDRNMDLENTSTKVGDLIRRLRTDATAQEIESVKPLDAEESAKLEKLKRNLSDSDLAKKVEHQRSMEIRLQRLKERVEAAAAQLAVAKLDGLRSAVTDAAQKAAVAQVAACKFQEQEDLLPGTGKSVWRRLFETAREFAAESHRGYTFPDIPQDSRCPLCQNPLGETGLDRLKKFDAYVSDKTTAEFLAAQRLKDTRVNEIKVITDGIGLDDALLKDISGFDPTLAQLCKEFQDRAHARRTYALSAAETGEGWDKIPDFPTNPSAHLVEAIAKLDKDRKVTEAMVDSKGQKLAHAEKDELAARKEAVTRKDDLLELVRRRDLCASLDRCIESANSTKISNKATELADSLAKDEVARQLSKELESVGIENWSITVKPETRYGNSQFKLVLQPNKAHVKPSTVLSEGEQRSVAIASFLAEVNLNQGKSGIVFDDPVSSLDHQRREKVARRLLEEAEKRQVIVFTHDFAFMCLIGAHDGARVTQRKIIHGHKGFGTVIRDPEFSTLSTNRRIKELDRICSEMKSSGTVGECPDGTNPIEAAFQKLRKTWEHAVEEVLFNAVITRYTEAVHTKQLRAVTVCDDDFRAIDEGMTICSKYSAHERAGHLQPPGPTLSELEKQIEKLADWYECVKGRKKETEKRREGTH